MPTLEFKLGLGGVVNLTALHPKLDNVKFWMEVPEHVENYIKKLAIHRNVYGPQLPILFSPDDFLAMTSLSAPWSIPGWVPLSFSEQLKKLAHESMKYLGKPIPDRHFGLLSTLLDARPLTTNPKSLHLSLQERREFEEILAKVTTVLQGSFALKVRKCSSNYFAITANPSRLRGTDKNTITDTDDSSALLAGMEQGLSSNDELTAAPIATAMETRKPDTSTRQRPSAIPAAVEEDIICPPLSLASAQIPTRESELREILGAYSITQPSRLKGFMIRQFGILFVALMPMVLWIAWKHDLGTGTGVFGAVFSAGTVINGMYEKMHTSQQEERQRGS